LFPAAGNGGNTSEYDPPTPLNPIVAPYTISPLTLANLPALSTLSREAFIDNAHTMTNWMFPGGSKAAVDAYRIKKTTHRFTKDTNRLYYKLIENVTGRMVAFSIWQRPQPPQDPAKEEAQRKAETGYKKNNTLPEGMNQRLMDDCSTAVDTLRDKYVHKDKDYGTPFPGGAYTHPTPPSPPSHSHPPCAPW